MRILSIGIILLFLRVDFTWGTEIYIPPMKGKKGKSIEIPIMINQVDNLAGIKLVIRYDSKTLIFKRGIKTKYSEPLMYVINSKKAGQLIIVMAGANGISGKSFPLLKLIFEVKDIKKYDSAWIKIVEAQLVSDKLNSIKCKILGSKIKLK